MDKIRLIKGKIDKIKQIKQIKTDKKINQIKKELWGRQNVIDYLKLLPR